MALQRVSVAIVQNGEGDDPPWSVTGIAAPTTNIG
jgi:hypothetical protein